MTTATVTATVTTLPTVGQIRAAIGPNGTTTDVSLLIGGLCEYSQEGWVRCDASHPDAVPERDEHGTTGIYSRPACELERAVSCLRNIFPDPVIVDGVAHYHKATPAARYTRWTKRVLERVHNEQIRQRVFAIQKAWPDL